MNHDELLARIDAWNEDYYQAPPLYHALRAVVELHEPNRNGACSECLDGEIYGTENHKRYPCPTIRAIERELA